MAGDRGVFLRLPAKLVEVAACRKIIGCLCAMAMAGMSIGTHADVRQTPHNMVHGGAVADPGEVCVFCHTPFVSTAPPSRGPAWQAQIGGDHVFSLYDHIGRQGEGGVPAVGSQSIACLSCHDANQAVSVAMRMSFDHPFGVPYRGYDRLGLQQPGHDGRRRSHDREGALVEARQLIDLLDFRVPVSGVVENRTVWWVPVTPGAVRRSRADLPLYLRRDGGDGEERPYIECSSCHDPHNVNRLFLRISNDGSQLCLVCHEK